MRLDQWLWAVRVFKSRSLAADAIKTGRVEVDGQEAKPAHEIRPEEVITVHFVERARILRVLGAPPSRVAAKFVPEYAAEERSNQNLNLT